MRLGNGIEFPGMMKKASMAAGVVESSAALCINDVLLHHLLVEVLVRIPVRDVFRSLSVCKLWFSSIRDPYFKRRFIIRQRVIEHQAASNSNSNVEDQEEDHQRMMIYAQCSAREMLLVTPTCRGSSSSIVKGLSDLSLNFLPFIAAEEDYYRTRLGPVHVILGSSNGLLLCSPYETYPATYYICNPLTKQWLALPPSPPSRDRGDFSVGFICDPFYQVRDGGDDDSLITLNDGFGFKVVRWRYSDSGADKNRNSFGMDVEVFSSDTGLWTTSRARCGKGVNDPDGLIVPNEPGVSFNGKLYWMLMYETLVYDPIKKEFFLDRIALPSDPSHTHPLVLSHSLIFVGLSQCQGALWAGQAYEAELRVYRMADGKWHLKHHAHVLDWLPGDIADVVKDAMSRYPNAVHFSTMHPDNPMIAYLTVENTLLECDFGGRTLKVVAKNLVENSERHKQLMKAVFVGDNEERHKWLKWSKVVTFSLPPWPTPLPALPAA